MQSQSHLDIYNNHYKKGLEYKAKKEYLNARLSFRDAMTVCKNELEALESKTPEVADYDKIVEAGKKLDDCQRLYDICVLETMEPVASSTTALALLKRAQAHYVAGDYNLVLQDCNQYFSIGNNALYSTVTKQDKVALQLKSDALFKSGKFVATILNEKAVWERLVDPANMADQIVKEIIDSQDFDWKFAIVMLILEDNPYVCSDFNKALYIRDYFDSLKLKDKNVHFKKLDSHCKKLVENCRAKVQFDIYKSHLKSNEPLEAYHAFIKSLEAIPYKSSQAIHGDKKTYSNRHSENHHLMMHHYFKFLLEEKETFFKKVILKLAPEMQLEAINLFINQDNKDVAYPVRQFYWVRRGDIYCTIDSGTLQLLNKQKMKLEGLATTLPATTVDPSSSVAKVSVFAKPVVSDGESSEPDIFSDVDGQEMRTFTKRH